MKLLSLILIVFFMALPAYSEEPEFDAVTQDDLDKIVEDFSSMFSHTSVSPASSLGSIFGIEAGILVGAVTTPGIEDVVSETDPDNDVDSLPYVGILGSVSVPFGLGFEVNFIPKTSGEDVEFEKTGIAVKWTLTDSLFELPMFDVAIKVHRTEASLDFTQTTNNPTTSGDVETKVAFSNVVTGASVTVSVDLAIVEPYVGFGFLDSEGELDTRMSSGTIFDSTDFPSAPSKAEADLSGNEFFIGAQLNLLIFRIGAEYAKVLESERMVAKLSLKF